VKPGRYLLWAAIALTAGGIVLADYFFSIELLHIVSGWLLRWAALLAAAALLLGLLNLSIVHLNKVSLQEKGWPYSAILVILFFGTLVLGLIFGVDSRVVQHLFTYVQLPVEASLVALLAVTLTFAGFRLFSRRRDGFSLLLLLTALFVLATTGPWLIGGESAAFDILSQLRNELTQVVAPGGARGILLGMALGTIATGLRVLLGADRPYGD
jgi:hypothetical protein